MNSLVLSALIKDEEQGAASSSVFPLPSIFELFLLEQTDSLLKPSLKHLLHAATGVPDTYTRGLDESSSLAHKIFDYYDPLYVLLSLLVQHNALQDDATVTEQLYGLRRVSFSGPVDAMRTDSILAPLSEQKRTLSIALVVLLPNIIEKLRTVYRYTPQAATPSSGNGEVSMQARLVAATKRIVPLLARLAVLGYDLSVVVQRVQYLFGRSTSSHPLLAVLGLSLVRRGGSQEQAPADTSSSSSSGSYRVLIFIAALIAIRAANWAVGSEAQELREQSSERIGGSGGPALFTAPSCPPPPPVMTTIKASPGLQDYNLCPLCSRQRKHPCASTGGFVFCYLCILAAVRKNPQCPVSGLPCRERDLVRIFQEDRDSA